MLISLTTDLINYTFLENTAKITPVGKMDKKISSTSQPRILKKKHFRVKHQKVKLFRANEPILSVFMWGINHTVSSVANIIYPHI